MSYGVYKVVHYLGIFVVLTVLAAAFGRGQASSDEDPWRKRFSAVHGVSLFLILLGGFGMLAKLGVDHGALFPGWIWAKLVIWLALGGALVAARRSRRWSVRLLFLVPILATLAAYLAFAKPF